MIKSPPQLILQFLKRNFSAKLFFSASVFSLTVFLFAPTNIYLTNIMEFEFTLLQGLLLFFVITIISFLLIYSIFSLLKGKKLKLFVSFFIGLSFLFWLQGNLIIWDYGVFDGRNINWESLYKYGLIDTTIWVFVLLFCMVKYDIIYTYSTKIAILLIFAQFVFIIFTFLTSPQEPSFKKYEIVTENKFEFSKHKNVVIILLDTFRSDVFSKIIAEHSDYKTNFNGFTFFKDAMGAFPTTYASVPNYLTGHLYDNSIPIQDFMKKSYMSQTSIPLRLRREGFEVELYGPGKYFYLDPQIQTNLRGKKYRYDTIFQIYDYSFFRYLPHFIKEKIFNNQKWFLHNFKISTKFPPKESTLTDKNKMYFEKASFQHNDIVFLNNFLNLFKLKDKPAVFKYYHLRGPHNPFILNESLSYEDMGSSYDSDGYVRTSRASLNLTMRMLEELKKKGIYDNSLIVVMADHANPTIVHESAKPLFLIKRINEQGAMKISPAPVTLGDLPATIFSEIGIETNENMKSVFDFIDDEERTRYFNYYTWDKKFGNFTQLYLPLMEKYRVVGPVDDLNSWDRLYADQPVARLNNKIFFTETGDSVSYFGVGWSVQEPSLRWTCSAKATLTFKFENHLEKDLIFRLKANPYLAGGSVDHQKIKVFINNRQTAEWAMRGEDWFEAPIPADLIDKAGIVKILFEISNPASPAEFGLSSDPRKLGFAAKEMVIVETK